MKKSSIYNDYLPLFRLLIEYLSRIRYKTFVAKSEADRNSCVRLRTEVFDAEFKRSVHGEEVIYSKQDALDAQSTIIACKDLWTDEIIGCARTTSAAIVAKYPAYFEEYKLHMIPKKFLSEISVGSRLCLKKNYRSRLIGYFIFQKIYEELINNRFAILLLVCEPGLYAKYQSFSFKHYGSIFQPSYGGYEIPLYAIIDNYDYCKKHVYDLYLIGKRKGFPHLSDDLEELKKRLNQLSKIDPGFEMLTDPTPYIDKCPLSQILSKKGKFAIFKHAILLKPNKNDIVIRQGSGEKYIAFINRGTFNIVVNNKIIDTLSKGNIFGEIAFLKQATRTASVICKSDNAEIIVFSCNLMHDLDEKDKKALTNYLSKTVNERLKALKKLKKVRT